MPRFTPPSTYTVPRVAADTPEADLKPSIYFLSDIPKGDNVWWYTDNTITTAQPALWEPRTNADGTITPGVKKVWYGGHTHDITDSEAVILTTAGFGAYITYTAIFDSSTYDSDTFA